MQEPVHSQKIPEGRFGVRVEHQIVLVQGVRSLRGQEAAPDSNCEPGRSSRRLGRLQ